MVFGLYTGWFRAPALLAGWAVGFVTGTTLVTINGMKPLHTFVFGDTKVTLYIGLIALAVNIAVTLVANVLVPSRRIAQPAQ